MLAQLLDPITAVRDLMRARDDLLAVWPKSFYRREFVAVRVLHRKIYVAMCPAAVQWVMVANDRNYRKSPATSQTLEPMLGESLFISEGELWARQRRIESPAAHGSRLPEYAKTIVECGRELIEKWKAAGPGAVVELTEDFTVLTAEIISRLMFGYSLGAKGREVFEIFKEYAASQGRVHVLEFLGLPAWFPRPGAARGRRAVKRLDDILYEIIRRGREQGPQAPENLLWMLFAFRDGEGKPMDARLVRDELSTIILAGHETTALTLGWAFHLLEQHPQAEVRLHEELDRVLAGREPSFADVPNLPYTRAVVDETLRLFPPVHVLSKQALGDDEIMGHRIPRGSFVNIPAYVLHRHKLYWEEPNAFKPERFLPENASKIHHYAYIPFGLGSRVCMGKHLGLLESVLMLAMFAGQYRLRLREGRVVEPVGRMTLRPRDGLPMRIEPRRRADPRTQPLRPARSA